MCQDLKCNHKYAVTFFLIKLAWDKFFAEHSSPPSADPSSATHAHVPAIPNHFQDSAFLQRYIELHML
ncbi:hypothetical protein SERLA73DRAFT_175336, partial [Serpula lacrymans var. lacrymans S7.3]